MLVCAGPVVVGASAGGVEALIALTEELPTDLPAAVFVVLHTTPYRPSRLPEILGQYSPLPVAHARHGEPIGQGRIYIAPPDYHLLVRDGTVELSHGPKENGTRPAIDPLFLSAARVYGPRVVAVILSGALGDGSAGMTVVRHHGGVGVVQIPGEAQFAQMPLTSIRRADPDHVLPVAEIGPMLARLAGEPVRTEGGAPMIDGTERATAMVQSDIDAQSEGRKGDGCRCRPERGSPALLMIQVAWQDEGASIPGAFAVDPGRERAVIIESAGDPESGTLADRY